MKASGPRIERETVITFNEDEATAQITTFSEGVYKKLLKRGWEPTEEYDRHAVFTVPKKAVKLPLNREGKPKRRAPVWIGKRTAARPAE